MAAQRAGAQPKRCVGPITLDGDGAGGAISLALDGKDGERQTARRRALLDADLHAERVEDGQREADIRAAFDLTGHGYLGVPVEQGYSEQQARDVLRAHVSGQFEAPGTHAPGSTQGESRGSLERAARGHELIGERGDGALAEPRRADEGRIRAEGAGDREHEAKR